MSDYASLTFSGVAVEALSDIAPLLMGFGFSFFVVFGTIFAIQNIKKLIISSSVSRDVKNKKDEYWQSKKEQYFNEKSFFSRSF